MPFLVTTCDDQGIVRFWEWDVDPLTRRADVPPADLEEIAEIIDAADTIYIHNAKFDARALLKIDISLPWGKVRDTLVAGHLLASNHPHGLTWMCTAYLGADIDHFERTCKEVVKECRAIVRRDYPTWRIATEDMEDLPSIKSSSKRSEDKPWKNDLWLPRALAKQYDLEGKAIEDARWFNSTALYANADSEHTLPLGIVVDKLIRHRGYQNIYEEKNKLSRIACNMEECGITAIGEWTENTITQYEEHVTEEETVLKEIAIGFGHDLELADGASINDNMRDFFYGAVKQSCPRCEYTKRIKHWNREEAVEAVCPKCLKGNRKRAGVKHNLVTKRRDNLALKVVISKKTGGACLDKDAIHDYLTTLEDGPALEFIEMLIDKREHETALSYMRQYRKFWVPVSGWPGFYQIHPSLNPCGTDHLRWASNSPNMQNVSGETKRLSNRACFGPLPDREWWRMDLKSIEARIPVYESKEPKMVEVFDHPDKEPYWGNLYYLTASVLYPDEFWPLTKQGPDTFKKGEPRLYKQAKFFVLAKQYGCGRRKGDSLSKIKGSFDLVDSNFPLLAALQAHYLERAEKDGYVETIPDKSVDPTRGYPILASRTEDGRVLSTTPFNYHVSGTACWVKNRALVKCDAQLEIWRQEGFNARIALEIHDEILFDFPRGSDPMENYPRALILKGLIESCGDDIGMPTPASISYHNETWAKEVPIT